MECLSLGGGVAHIVSLQKWHSGTIVFRWWCCPRHLLAEVAHIELEIAIVTKGYSLTVLGTIMTFETSREPTIHAMSINDIGVFPTEVTHLELFVAISAQGSTLTFGIITCGVSFFCIAIITKATSHQPTIHARSTQDVGVTNSDHMEHG